MPELPEVETMVRGVRPHLLDRQIVSTEFCACDRKPISVDPQRPAFQRQIREARIEDVTPGKTNHNCAEPVSLSGD